MASICLCKISSFALLNFPQSSEENFGHAVRARSKFVLIRSIWQNARARAFLKTALRRRTRPRTWTKPATPGSSQSLRVSPLSTAVTVPAGVIHSRFATQVSRPQIPADSSVSPLSYYSHRGKND